ncbi:hypothetical protein HYS29_02445 [Candidatus Microgenomates bacterium]|nr:hypothetical protein [Candidatus Microgenomates bacterium]MBI2622435.1 hypothetical protein [Candidatus Microgenomates bacterium]
MLVGRGKETLSLLTRSFTDRWMGWINRLPNEKDQLKKDISGLVETLRGRQPTSETEEKITIECPIPAGVNLAEVSPTLATLGIFPENSRPVVVFANFTRESHMQAELGVVVRSTNTSRPSCKFSINWDHGCSKTVPPRETDGDYVWIRDEEKRLIVLKELAQSLCEQLPK